LRCLARQPFFVCDFVALRWRALRPQLKRDSLGGSPHESTTNSDGLPMRSVQLAVLLLCAWSNALTPRGQASASCAVYAAAIDAVTDSGPVVVIDSTGAGVPTFAFMAYSDSPRTPAQQGLPLSDSVFQALRTTNQHRESLRGCLAALQRVRPVRDDSLIALFGRDTKGWARFRAHYAGVRGFILVSQPLMLADSVALIYVAYASDWLAGQGAILRLERDSAGHWVRKAGAVLWNS